MRFIIRTALLVAAILGAAYYFPEITVRDTGTAIILVLVLGILNLTVKPLLILFTIPVTILTFGLFLLVINTLIVLLADWLIGGFEIASFGWAFIFALLLSVFNYLIDKLLEKD